MPPGETAVVPIVGMPLTQDEEDTLLSAIAEADRYIRTTPREQIDPAVVRRLLDEALAQLR